VNCPRARAILRPLVLLTFAALLLVHTEAEAASPPSSASVQADQVELDLEVPPILTQQARVRRDRFKTHMATGWTGYGMSIVGPYAALLHLATAYGTVGVVVGAAPMAVGASSLVFAPIMTVTSGLLAARQIRAAGGRVTVIPGVLSGAGTVAALAWGVYLADRGDLMQTYFDHPLANPLQLYVVAQGLGALQLAANHFGWGFRHRHNRRLAMAPVVGADREAGLAMDLSF